MRPPQAIERLDGLERRQNTAVDSDMGRRQPTERDHLAILVDPHVDDPPAGATDKDKVAATDVASVGGLLKWRNLHGAPASAVQNVPAAKLRAS